MEFLSRVKEPYQAVLDGKWEAMIKYYSEGPGADALLFPISMDKDTAFHLAVYSGRKEPLQSLLGLFDLDDQVFMENMYGNTVLHEAAISGNLEAVKILVSKFHKLVNATNELGETPLFRAASFGKRRIVKYLASQSDHMLISTDQKQLQDTHRQRKDGASILHAAVQGEHCGTALELLELDEELANLKYKMGPVFIRLHRLHSVADTKHYNRGTSSGPVYNLQEELEWFSTVEKLIPSHYKTHRDNKDKTAMELFKEMHEKQLENAQRWIKETSQSCSGVAVLVATVVFAAAFTVPGGTNDSNGQPILLRSPFFLFFTVMDVVSLSCSLTAIVMFLSVVTSPFELEDFLVSLPRRLTLGFALLFMSVATTMLAFTSTIVLIIHLDQSRQWTMTLICSAAFFPVSVLALTHFPLFVSFLIAWKNLFKFVWNALLCNLVLGWLKNLGKTNCEHLPITDKGK
ncbi:hypothetical protein LWI28_015724 [Acer negundo]|uniref:PGG domain-containing protein n=1 Tax=Acer negundo TaxID=4023 RepID=A0AAD5NJN0_ACENE|nr:hypothetical protein LWI28_015724 [Acer negundo]